MTTIFIDHLLIGREATNAALPRRRDCSNEQRFFCPLIQLQSHRLPQLRQPMLCDVR
jgi:hypothetical protein